MFVHLRKAKRVLSSVAPVGTLLDRSMIYELIQPVVDTCPHSHIFASMFAGSFNDGACGGDTVSKNLVFNMVRETNGTDPQLQSVALLVLLSVSH
eukprot:COSAG06_NODE_3161_length_5755_cov_3.280941_4_plen_95_part_00